jgi:transcriptional regulator with XRE-family HTH domain
MTLAQKLRQLRQLEGDLRGLGRELSQSELVRAIKSELKETISQSYLSLIEKGSRKHLSNESRQLLARFFKVHPGYLVSDPPDYHTELTSEVATTETRLDRWLVDGATRFAHDPALAGALERLAAHAETRRCLILLGEMISMPGLVDRLSDTLVPEERS